MKNGKKKHQRQQQNGVKQNYNGFILSGWSNFVYINIVHISVVENFSSSLHTLNNKAKIPIFEMRGCVLNVDRTMGEHKNE